MKLKRTILRKMIIEEAKKLQNEQSQIVASRGPFPDDLAQELVNILDDQMAYFTGQVTMRAVECFGLSGLDNECVAEKAIEVLSDPDVIQTIGKDIASQGLQLLQGWLGNPSIVNERKVTPAELRNIISEEIEKFNSKKKLNEGIIEQAINMIKPMIAEPFNEAGYDGDAWADDIVDAVLDAGLDDRVNLFLLGGLLRNEQAKRDISRVLNFNPRDIAEADDPDGEVIRVAEDILSVLVRHGYADTEQEADDDTGWW